MVLAFLSLSPPDSSQYRQADGPPGGMCGVRGVYAGTRGTRTAGGATPAAHPNVGAMKIAIVGTGIAGLAAAHGLHREHQLTLYEANDHVGGHSHTVDCQLAGRRFAVDTGFIVFNNRTYPRFCRLLSQLGVESQPTEMSFSVRCDRSGLEYNGNTLNTLFAQRRNLINPRFLGLIRDILRFNREAPRMLEGGSVPATLGAYLAQQRYGRLFVTRYLLPMAAAIWSCPVTRIADYPLVNFVRFFQQHGLLSVKDRPQWRVVRGGSRAYVQALSAPFSALIRLRTPVRHVRRLADAVEVTADGLGTERFDRVVIATHSDQALRLLADPTPLERELLGAIPYQTNLVTLHTDTAGMPRTRRAWASWNCLVPAAEDAPLTVTYDMNRLQGLDAPETFCVTLGEAVLDPAKVIARFTYQHPVFTPAAAAAQEQVHAISGLQRTHYCGAYWSNGFHEDGVASGERVVAELNAAARSAAPERPERRLSA